MQHKKVFFLTIFLVFCVIYLGIIETTRAQVEQFPRPLSLGVSGDDVRELQRILNRDVETQIVATGPGSPGNETDYFGRLTLDAVVRFQEKYRQEILVPNGLSIATGYVGLATKSVLRRLHTDLSATAPITDLVADVSGITSIVTTSSNTTSNPNEENADVFLAAIDRVGTSQGVSKKVLDQVKEQVRLDIATSTDLRAKFIDVVGDSISKAPVPVRSVIARIIDPFRKVFVPKRAQAVGVGFGGALTFAFFCPCSANWLVTVQPLPPTYVTLLSYVPGTQVHLSYNIPFTARLLGQYTPGAGICLIYTGDGCHAVPSEGLISPNVGSSAI